MVVVELFALLIFCVKEESAAGTCEYNGANKDADKYFFMASIIVQRILLYKANTFTHLKQQKSRSAWGRAAENVTLLRYLAG